MVPRRWSVRPALGLLLLALAGSAGCSDDAAEPPDFDLILVSVDTLRADRMSVYGADRPTDGTPQDEWTPAWLAAQGTVFEHCWAPAGKTVPSLASFWTGIEPLEHGAHQVDATQIQWRTFAESYKASGFTTMARAANIQLTPQFQHPSGTGTIPGYGFHRGFDDYGIRAKDKEPLVHRDLIAAAKAPISEKKPLLLWAHYMAPHQSYSPPAKFDQWSDSGLPEAETARLKSVHVKPETLTGELKEQFRNKYDGEVRTASDYVSKLLAGLDKHYRDAGRGGLLDNAVVVFFSDHGEELADHHAYFMHAKSLYTGVIRVPLIIAGMDWSKGHRDETAISLLEVMPLIMNGTPPGRTYFCSSWISDFYSIRDDRWTLVHNPCGQKPMGPEEPPQEGAFPYPEVALFDRIADPFEQNDVSAANPDVTRRMLGELRAWYDKLVVYRGPRAGQGMTQEQLQELGYVGMNAEVDCEPWRPDQWKP